MKIQQLTRSYTKLDFYYRMVTKKRILM